MTDLFDPITLGAITLQNRIIMAPLTRSRAGESRLPNDLMAEYYAQRASAGLIISEATAISPQAYGWFGAPALYTPEQQTAWEKITRAVHEKGGKIVLQLWHMGRVSHPDFQGGALPVGPSAIAATGLANTPEGKKPYVTPRALEAAELPGIVQDYANAAKRAIAAGFDGVEIHAANGYLIDQFLKTGANQRTDDYGGSIQNRARLLLEVTRAVADAAGAGKVGIRLSPVTPANDIVDVAPQPLFDYVVRKLAPMGLAYIHIIEGATGGPRDLPERPFDYAALKAAYRQAGGKGAWMVNNGYTGALAEEVVADGRADIVAFGKDFISNPDLVARLKAKAPLTPWDQSTFYGGGAKGYTDYPVMS